MATTEGLREPFRSVIEAMIAESVRRWGEPITLSSGLRTYAQQVQLRREHCGTSHYAIYEMPASQCSPDTARPGSSKHEQGTAVDFTNTDRNIARVEQLVATGRYPIHRTVPSERWHYEPTGATTAPVGPSGPIGPDSPTTVPADSSQGGDGGGSAGIFDFVRLLLSGAFWLRVTQLLAGAALVAVGWLIIQRDSVAAAGKLALAVA